MSERVKIVMLVIGAALTLIGGVWLLQSAIVSRLVAWPDPNGFLVMAEAGWTAFAAVVLAILGTLGTIGGIALVLYAGTRPASENGTSDTDTYPLGLRAQLDEPLGRWLWLIKWILAIPHFVVLAFLWLAFWILTVAAFVSILGSGRYPQAIFATNVGIMRWSWRVAVYSYGTLSTDRYPPFTLGDADYPAHLSVAFPHALSRRLVLVKWWLLALPHYLIIGIFCGPAPSGVSGAHLTGGLVPLLACIVGYALLFTGRYPRGLFDLLVGLNRWLFRVIGYVALMYDDYPPFRIDLGGEERIATVALSV